MSEFKEVAVGANLKLTSGFPFASSKFSNEGFPLIRIRDILTSQTETCFSGTFPPGYIIKKGDILIGMDGDFHVVKWRGNDALLNQRVLKVEVKNEFVITLDYLFHWLGPFIKKVNDITAATTVKHLSVKDLAKAKAKVPDVEVQKKIAAILTTIDNAIEKTETLIAKYQQIKAGLMHDLFTRGVLPNGQLRPPRIQAPELYQETAIGWIPREWKVPTLEELLAPLPNNIRSGPFGSALLKHELVEDGIPLLGIDNVHVERFEPEFRRFVNERKFKELAKYRVRPRDVVITIMGTVGRCCVIPDNLELGLSSKHLWTMTFDLEKVIPELICWQLNHSAWAKAWFRRAMQGGIMDAIQSSTLKTLHLPVPDINEQTLIYARYVKVSAQIQQESSLLKKLRKQKRGLMQDLLTGKVPVQVNELDMEVSA
ncbi:restriction endonuclease subunit S [Sodalis sp. RH20]|uniref:restriction endonuclease subunit S n=1 Tax=unclassified Sodalis (in: enterobacteria) TaxID=2636512 RepID=UPI0039B68ADB